MQPQVADSAWKPHVRLECGALADYFRLLRPYQCINQLVCERARCSATESRLEYLPGILERHPTGAAIKLLSIVKRKGLDAIE